MSVAIVFDHCQSINNQLVIEYYYKGEKIEDPSLFFDMSPGLFDLAFPSPEETNTMINKNVIFCETHKLVVSEFGFNLVFR